MTQIDKISTRPCPECGADVEVDSGKVKSVKTYICTQCGAGLWLIQGSILSKLVTAQVRT
jgi:Zn-finger nucleic acid-binding protein